MSGSAPRSVLADLATASLTELADVQRATARLLLAQVDQARAQGLTWSQIGAALDMVRETVFRQHQARSPIVVVRPRHTAP